VRASVVRQPALTCCHVDALQRAHQRRRAAIDLVADAELAVMIRAPRKHVAVAVATTTCTSLMKPPTASETTRLPISSRTSTGVRILARHHARAHCVPLWPIVHT
jgi:hypothetical protein